MKTVILLALLLVSPVIFSAEASGILVLTGLDPSGQVQFTCTSGVCSASNPSVGALAVVRGKDVGAPERPINYLQTSKGGYISAMVGYGTFKITAPAGVSWAITNNGLNANIDGKNFGIGTTVSGTGSKTFTIEEK